MSNQLFDNARRSFLRGTIIWGSTSGSIAGDTIKAMLIANTASLAAQVFVADFTSVIVARSGAFTTKEDTNGAASADNVTFASITTGMLPGGATSVGAIVIYKDTGTDSTSPCIAWIDSATGLPIVPNGGDIICTWDTGANKIFKL